MDTLSPAKLVTNTQASQLEMSEKIYDDVRTKTTKSKDSPLPGLGISVIAALSFTPPGGMRNRWASSSSLGRMRVASVSPFEIRKSEEGDAEPASHSSVVFLAGCCRVACSGRRRTQAWRPSHADVGLFEPNALVVGSHSLRETWRSAGALRRRILPRCYRSRCRSQSSKIHLVL